MPNKEDDDKNNTMEKIDHTHCCYLQPYWLPPFLYRGTKDVHIPMFEMLGPYQGYRLTRPRLPIGIDNGTSFAASEALWSACQEVTGCTWSSS